MPPQARSLSSEERLNSQQRQRLREVFDALDTDGSDELDYTELKDALQQFGVKLSLKELKAIWVAADKDASSGIDFNEFCDAVEQMPATLANRQESMKHLQAVLSGEAGTASTKHDEGTQCLVK